MVSRTHFAIRPGGPLSMPSDYGDLSRLALEADPDIGELRARLAPTAQVHVTLLARSHCNRSDKPSTCAAVCEPTLPGAIRPHIAHI